MWNFEELEEDINNFNDVCQEPYLTRQDYEKSLNVEYRSNNDESINITEDYAYQGIIDNIMVKLQHKYNLRPRDISITTTQLKKILSRSKELRQLN